MERLDDIEARGIDAVMREQVANGLKREHLEWYDERVITPQVAKDHGRLERDEHNAAAALDMEMQEKRRDIVTKALDWMDRHGK